MKEDSQEKKDEAVEKPKRFDEEWEYVGNIWGWKFSFISLGIIIFMLALMALRYYTMETKPDSILQEQVIETDSLSK